MAAADESYSLLLTPAGCRGAAQQGIPPDKLQISFGPQHDRKPHAELDSQIDGCWAEALKANPRIFDGAKFRLRRIAWSADGDAVEVELGLTGYREYLGTNRLPEAQRLRLEEGGERDHGDRCAHLANALGCEALLLTGDEQAVMLRRSGAVSTHSGLYNGPSGHPEPKSAGIEAESVDGSQEEVERVRRELFDSVLEEIKDETNVPGESLSPPLLMGCMRDSAGKPDVLFLVRTSLDAAAVCECYAKGAAEGWESDRLAFCPVAELGACALPMTAVTRAAVACFLQLPPAGGAQG